VTLPSISLNSTLESQLVRFKDLKNTVVYVQTPAWTLSIEGRVVFFGFPATLFEMDIGTK